ncbi:MAG TPA: sulfatase [Chloroflexi bacterium]|jgi:N-sulfoglucosamine sulfohydrolase|nr:sulfatase [Chloroflexota bacterium]
MTKSRPNILYIHSHDTGRYVQPYGYPVPTPAIQRLAEEGVVFRQAFCAAPTCSPSRAGLLTGQCAHSSGMIGLAHRGFRLNDYSQHLVHTLRRAGYASTLIGVQHVAADADQIGYDHVVPLAGTEARFVAPAAVDFLRNAPARPFFLSVGFDETHRVFHTPGADEVPRYVRPPAPLPDTPETRRDMAAFKASARVLDEGVGAVLDALDDAGLADNTLVICTTDHGPAFPAMKCNLTDHGIGVMLIMRGPGGFTGGRVLDTMISHVDVFPTLCDLLSIDPPSWLQGHSFMPVIRGETDEIHDEIFAEVTYHAAYEPQRCVRTRRWKYIRRYSEQSTPVLPNCDDSPSKDAWLAHDWRNRPVAAEQLYDLVYDPNEAHNLAGDPAAESVLNDMRARLNAWMQHTDDPLLHSAYVAAPAGAVVNDPTGLSPQEPVQPA